MAKPKKATCRRCLVCSHPERVRIEMLRLAGSTADHLSERFGIGRDSVYRHMENHVSDEDKAALLVDTDLKDLAERAAAEGGALLDYLALVRATVMKQMIAASASNDRKNTAALGRAAVDVLDKMGRLTGELVTASNVTNITTNTAVVMSPAWNRLQRMLLERLAPFPDALGAVLAGLDELEGGDGPPEPPQPSAPMMLEGHALAA